jgi:hypothetical protein
VRFEPEVYDIHDVITPIFGILNHQRSSDENAQIEVVKMLPFLQSFLTDKNLPY